jgi:tape measure domain-containing protein
MAADGGDSASFTVRLVNQVMAPARQIKGALGDVEKAFKSAQKTLAAPTPKRGPLSDWDKMVAGAKKSQASDFAKQHLASIKQQNAALKNQQAIRQKLAQHHADHGASATLTGAASEAAIGATYAVAAAAVAAVAAVGYLTYKFAEASLEAGKFAERSRLAMSFLTGSGPLAAIQFDALRHEAQGLGLDVEDTQHSFQKLLAAQFSIGKSRELIRMGSDLQAIGASADEVSGALLAITQIKSKGRLQAQEMLQLQERGISSELVYNALQSKLGKTRDQVQKMQQGGKISGDVAIEAILEAVRHKTGTTKAGEAGANFANNTITGLGNQLHAGVQNFFIDVGDALLPGFTVIAGRIKAIVTTLANDPQIAALGTFLLSEFQIFTLWLEANWPQISATLVASAHLMADSVRFVVECFDLTTMKGQALAGIMAALAVTFGIVALAAFTLGLPLYAFIAVIGLVVYAVIEAVGWIWDKIKALGNFLGIGGGTATPDAPGVPAVAPQTGYGVGPWANIPTLSTPASNDNAIQGVTAAPGAQALSGMTNATAAGEERGGSPVHVDSLAVHVQAPADQDPEHMGQIVGQAVHSELAKIMRQAS